MTEHDAKGLEIIAGWLQRDGLIEPAAMLRRLAAGASEGQAVYQVQDPCEGTWEDTDWLTYESTDGAFKRIVYAHPSAEIAALRERIAEMEKDAATYREAGVWDTDGKKFRTYSAENLNGKAMYMKEPK